MLRDEGVPILVAEGFGRGELTEPRKPLEEAGARRRIVSASAGEVHGWKHAICHGRGAAACVPAILKSALTHAAAKCSDEEVVVDSGIVSSRKSQDIPVLKRKMLFFLEGASLE